VAIASAILLAAPLLHAQQSSASAQPSSAAKQAEAKAAEEGDKVFKWIIMHAEKPRKATEAKAAAVAAPAAPLAKHAAAPAPAPVAHRAKDEGITERVTPLIPPTGAAVAASPASAGAPVATAAPAPAASTPSTALALAPKTTEPPPAPEPEPEEEDEPLVMVKSADPEMPRSLLTGQMTKGTVQVRFEVKPDGSVDDVEVVKSTQQKLNRSATTAVSQWRFKPIKHAQYGMVEMVFDPDR
jgi:TonB family protein